MLTFNRFLAKTLTDLKSYSQRLSTATPQLLYHVLSINKMVERQLGMFHSITNNVTVVCIALYILFKFAVGDRSCFNTVIFELMPARTSPTTSDTFFCCIPIGSAPRVCGMINVASTVLNFPVVAE